MGFTVIIIDYKKVIIWHGSVSIGHLTPSIGSVKVENHGFIGFCQGALNEESVQNYESQLS